jgi:hypothetical protein
MLALMLPTLFALRSWLRRFAIAVPRGSARSSLPRQAAAPGGPGQTWARLLLQRPPTVASKKQDMPVPVSLTAADRAGGDLVLSSGQHADVEAPQISVREPRTVRNQHTLRGCLQKLVCPKISSVLAGLT